MFPTIKHSSQTPVRAPEVEQPLLPQTADKASTSQHSENQSTTSPGGMLSRVKPPAWLNSARFAFTGNSSLHQAVQEGDLTALQGLLKHVDPGMKNKRGQTPLDCAVEKGNLEIVKALLANPNVRPDMADKNGRTPLSHAVEKGDLEIVKALLGHPSVKPDTADNNMRTPLSYAAEKGRFDLIELLLAKGAHPILPDKNGLAPLDYAVANGHRKAAETILQNTRFKLDLNLKGMDGKTLLHRAVEKNHPEIIALLLEQGDRIDPNIQNSEGLTPLALAAQENKVSSLTTLLKSPKVEINKADQKENTPLHHAVGKDHPEIIALLLEQGDRIDPNIQNSEGLTPLALAAQENKVSSLTTLLKSPKVEINKADQKENTPLHHAVEKDHREGIKLLLAQRGRINPNLQNSEGLTPIALAAQKDSSFALRMLMNDEGVDVNLPNNAGETPFFIAAKAHTVTAWSEKEIVNKGFNVLLGAELPLFGDIKFHKTRVDYLRPRNDGMTPLQYLMNTIRNAPDREDELSKEARQAVYYLENMIANEHIRKDIPRANFDQALSTLKEKNYSSYQRIRDRVS